MRCVGRPSNSCLCRQVLHAYCRSPDLTQGPFCVSHSIRGHTATDKTPLCVSLRWHCVGIRGWYAMAGYDITIPSENERWQELIVVPHAVYAGRPRCACLYSIPYNESWVQAATFWGSGDRWSGRCVVSRLCDQGLLPCVQCSLLCTCQLACLAHVLSVSGVHVLDEMLVETGSSEASLSVQHARMHT